MNLDIIKKASTSALKAQQPMSILFGKVITAEPIRVKVGEFIVLNKKQLVVDSLVTDGEDVILIKQQGGQKYLVLSTVFKVIEGDGTSGGISTGSPTGWTTVTASAYNQVGQLAANGERITSTGLTVAVPMGRVYRTYKNRMMQIEYNGKVITAKVTDCGDFGADNTYKDRQLDLSYGVWKAFGFNSANAWGLRKVRYRYI